MKSMTGHGQASWAGDAVAIDVQMRSVNNRFLKVAAHLPDVLEGMGPVIEEALRKHIERGTVHVDVQVRHAVSRDLPVVNEELLQIYYDQLRAAAKRLGMKDAVSLETLLALPGVLDSPDPGAHAEELNKRVLSLVEAAAKELCDMRRREGERTARELGRLLTGLEKDLKKVRKLAPRVPQAHQERMLTRINSLLAPGLPPLEPESLARELATFADRCDISEEMQRLESHLTELRKLIAAEGEAGKKLDFLSQELLRETNTIGSKANDAEIASLVISMKCVIEKIKEQIQNIE